MAPPRYAAKFDPFLSLDCTWVEGVGERKGRDPILPSGNLAHRRDAEEEERRRVRAEGGAVGRGGARIRLN